VTPLHSRPAPGGGRWLQVDPERLARWLAGFEARHGQLGVETGPTAVTCVAADGSLAELRVPFPVLATDPGDRFGGIVAHACTDRRVGVVLFRLGGHAAGVFEGSRMVASKVGSRQVHGRSAAGGWSQQRFARRRAGQVVVATAAAADTAAAVLLPWVDQLDAVVLGGDRGAVAALLDDPRLRGLRPLLAEPLLDVPDPRQRILEQAPRMFRAVRIRLVETPAPPQPPPI